jgi:hypothetical protein
LAINNAKSLFGLIEQVECSSTFKGIQNLECAVLPPGSNNDAIPLDATFKTISPLV